VVSSRLKDEHAIIEALLHEMLHAGHWDLDEAAVDETARDMAKILAKCGVGVDMDIWRTVK
jgi:hypothetical protein